MSTLKKIKTSELANRITKSDFTGISKLKEPFFVVEVKNEKVTESDSLVNVEISLRRGERVGLFSVKNEKPA